ncbi:MAG: DegV family protein [Chloroflexi bacterium]|nr:DegV family protein [Chloroflexota bacterium]
MNAPFGILTDGTCTLPSGAALDVDVVPLHVRFGTESYTSGGDGDLSHARFYELIADRRDRPTTSQPSPGEWVTRFDAARARGQRDLLVITIASEMSGTFASATVAARTTDLRVAVVDSRTNSGGQGLIVAAVARAREQGRTFDEVVALAQRLAGRPRIFAYVDTLEFLRRSGRVPAAQAIFGSLLAVKPIVRIADGRTEVIGRVRTRPRAVARLKELATEMVGSAKDVRIAVVHTNAPQIAADVAAWAGTALDHRELFSGEAGPVLAAHVGPGVVAIAIMKEDE